MPSIQSQIQNQMSMLATVDGKALQGSVHELKEGVTIAQAKDASKGDGLDQVFIQAGSKNFVIQGDGLDIKSLKNGKQSFVQLYVGDKAVRAEVKDIDNEKNTLKEGAWNLGTKIGVGGVVGSVALAVVGSMLEGGGPDGGGAIVAGMALGSLALGLTGISAAGGGVFGALRGSDENQLKPLLKN